MLGINANYDEASFDGSSRLEHKGATRSLTEVALALIMLILSNYVLLALIM